MRCDEDLKFLKTAHDSFFYCKFKYLLVNGEIFIIILNISIIITVSTFPHLSQFITSTHISAHIACDALSPSV